MTKIMSTILFRVSEIIIEIIEHYSRGNWIEFIENLVISIIVSLIIMRLTLTSTILIIYSICIARHLYKKITNIR